MVPGWPEQIPKSALPCSPVPGPACKSSPVNVPALASSSRDPRSHRLMSHTPSQGSGGLRRDRRAGSLQFLCGHSRLSIRFATAPLVQLRRTVWRSMRRGPVGRAANEASHYRTKLVTTGRSWSLQDEAGHYRLCALVFIWLFFLRKFLVWGHFNNEPVEIKLGEKVGDLTVKYFLYWVIFCYFGQR